MADPNSIDDLTKVAGVSAGGGGLVVAITTLIGKFITSSKLEEVRQQNAQLAAQVANLTADIKVLLAASERRDQQHERLDAERRFADLEARMKALEVLVDRAVAQ